MAKRQGTALILPLKCMIKTKTEQIARTIKKGKGIKLMVPVVDDEEDRVELFPLMVVATVSQVKLTAL